MSTSRASSPELRAHQQWLGFVQPVGLVVSLPALEKAQCYVARSVVREQEALVALAHGPKEDEPDRVTDFRALCRDVFGWSDTDLVAPDESYTVDLREHGDTLRPTYVVVDPDAPRGLALVVVLDAEDEAIDLDAPHPRAPWNASPEARLERLLRESQISLGILSNGTSIRLVYAPRGESSGHVTFEIRDMLTVAGRPLLAGLHALLCADRMFNLGASQRLLTILEDSRKYQSEVSTQLSEQVLGALHELLRGFQTAHEASDRRLLAELLREDPDEVYGGLLTVLLRLVFILYAEDRGLISQDPVYARHYAIAALFEKLREDNSRYPDTMDQRYGAWARLMSVFRLIHDGAAHGSFRLPPRYGRLFDPDAYPFLEGRPPRATRQLREHLVPPRVSDGVVYRVLEKLLILDGDRLSYRTLDVEQVGSVYEAMMGFSLEVVREQSLGLRGKRKPGAPPADPVVGLETLLAKKAAERIEHLKKTADVELPDAAAKAVKQAKTIEELIAAIGRRVSPFTPHVLTSGSMALQPTEERRRSGSHYTPRILTEPIVEKTVRPVLEALGDRPTPDQILSLKVCDPAMGSGAFLVAVCRALGEVLVRSWQHHEMPEIPADEDPLLFARRQVAQRCLYGVDKNPFAVDLAKLSLWLVTLAKDHPFTFLDHALRCGDSLVGLTRAQIAGLSWAPEADLLGLRGEIDRELERAEGLREQIQRLSGSDDTAEKQRLLEDADAALARVRRVGDLIVEAFFAGDKEKARRQQLAALSKAVAKGLERLPEVEEPRSAFHWEIEFPEVFSGAVAGFDAVVGNPPFAGKNNLLTGHGKSYLDWLQTIHEGAHGNADLVAHFFRRAFGLLRRGGALGLIATNTIAQGDTRSTGLRWLLANGGVLYDATRRYKWPGGAAVIVSVVHVAREPQVVLAPRLDDRPVPRISAFLFHTGPDEDPSMLRANQGKSFVGSYVLGMGFTFDDTNEEASPISEMERLIAKNPKNRERIFPYLGGEELNTSPTHAHHRYVINFGQMSEEEARAWPDLMAIVEAKVKPARLAQNREIRARYWWRFGETTPALYAAIRGLDRVLVIARVSNSAALAFVKTPVVLSEQLIAFVLSSIAGLALLQSRPHEIWARFLGSSMKDDLRYTPSDCFETFPFPRGWDSSPTLESTGQTYYDYRAQLMVANNQGLTTTHNRLHDPEECDPAIHKLRELHTAMDRAVLDAYGWADLQPTCEFLLDYEDESDDDEDDGKRRRKKKPWRYRWPDDIRDEVLARLLALNAERAAEEKRLGAEAGR